MASRAAVLSYRGFPLKTVLDFVLSPPQKTSLCVRLSSTIYVANFWGNVLAFEADATLGEEGRTVYFT